MRSPFEGFSPETIVEIIGDKWGLRIAELRYLPLGAGAYHWSATTSDHHRYFVTCDDLATKPWLGSDRDTVFDGLLAAYTTASRLRAEGLAFVVAPMVNGSGAVAERIDECHSLSVFEHVEGEPGEWGQPLPAGDDTELVSILARLHQTSADGQRIAARPFEVPDRGDLEAALEDVHQPWTGGPLAELARHELASHADVVTALLDEIDQFAATEARSHVDPVVTHGEPHPGNLIRTADGLVMVDWDTVALAQPERDLWMLADDETLIDGYECLTEVTIDRRALAAYRLMWSLTDLAAYTLQLRREHQHGADSDRALAAIRSILDGDEPQPHGRLNRPACPG